MAKYILCSLEWKKLQDCNNWNNWIETVCTVCTVHFLTSNLIKWKGKIPTHIIPEYPRWAKAICQLQWNPFKVDLDVLERRVWLWKVWGFDPLDWCCRVSTLNLDWGHSHKATEAFLLMSGSCGTSHHSNSDNTFQIYIYDRLLKVCRISIFGISDIFDMIIFDCLLTKINKLTSLSRQILYYIQIYFLVWQIIWFVFFFLFRKFDPDLFKDPMECLEINFNETGCQDRTYCVAPPYFVCWCSYIPR